jgi:hypothetical protein
LDDNNRRKEPEPFELPAARGSCTALACLAPVTARAPAHFCVLRALSGMPHAAVLLLSTILLTFATFFHGT